MTVQHWPDRLIAPGFVDTHVHYPQVDVIGSPADGLLPWLENYTFPVETKFADPAHAQAVAGVFLDELQRHGVTTALAFATSHPTSVDALFVEAQARRMRLITGMCLMVSTPPTACATRPAHWGVAMPPNTACSSPTLIQRWHGQSRLGYAITRALCPLAPMPSCAARASWPPGTRMCGCSRTWPKTAMK